MTAGSVLPLSTRLTDADYRRLVAATVGRLCLVHGKDRLALEAGCDERTMRHARDERTSLSAASLFNMLALDASALDELASHFGLKLVALEASDKAEGELLTGTLALAHGHAAALADGKICHVEAPSARSLGVSQGNRTRRINEMRRAREAMAAALGGHDETQPLDA